MIRPPPVAALVAAAALLAAAPAGALDFLPRIVNFGGELEVGGLSESISNTTANGERKTTDTFFTERLSFSAAGWLYHPRFMVFRGEIGGGLAHEDLSSDDPAKDSGGFVTEPLEEYEIRTLFLPEHPYNLELFALRRNPYERGRLMLGGETVGAERGVLFTYKNRPVALTLSYRDSTSASGRFDRHTDTLFSNASLFGEWGSLSGEAAHTEADGSFEEVSMSSVTDEARLDNQLRWLSSRVTLGSNAGWLRSRQESEGESTDDRSFNWTERLGIELPWQLSVNASYDRNEDSTERRSEGGSPATLENTTDTATLSVMHRLYQSLTTTYDITALRLDSTTGDTTGLAHALNFTYTKSLPRGMLIATLGAGSSTSERGGAPVVVNELHPAALFGEFALERSGADPDSVRLGVKSATTGDLVDLVPDVHFRVVPLGEEVRVLVFALPAAALSPDPFFVYTLLATYSFAREAATVDTTTRGGSLRLELFDRLVTPYAAWAESRQEETGGPRTEPIDSDSTTFGLLLQRLPYSLTLERQMVASDLNPYDRDKAQLDVRSASIGAAQLLAQLTYTQTRHDTGEYQQVAYTEELLAATARVQWRLPARHLTLVLGGTWNQGAGLADRESFSFDGELVWAYRQLEVTASASVGSSTLDMEGSRQESAQQMYYLKVVRRLF